MATRTTGISRDLLIHPGETISDILAERGISQAALAACTGVTPAFVSSVISGKKDISASFAMALEYALGVPKSFWLNLQANYDAELLELSESESVTDNERLACKTLREIVGHLQDVGLIKQDLSTEGTILALRSVLRISNISNLSKLVPQGAFRISEAQKTDPLILGAWMRLCQITNENVNVTNAFDPSRTDSLVKEIKALMVSCPASDLSEQLQKLLAQYGIAFSIIRHFKGAPVHGYVSRRENGSFQMAVTIRESWEDIFWFSLFHELGHIYNGDINAKKKEFVDFGANQDQESLADAFARDSLINPTAYRRLVSGGAPSYSAIKAFAFDQGIKPCIVIGRLQKDGIIPWSRFARQKPRLKWATRRPIDPNTPTTQV